MSMIFAEPSFHYGSSSAWKTVEANVDDRVYMKALAEGLTGQLYGDKGYIINGRVGFSWCEFNHQRTQEHERTKPFGIG